MANTQPHREIPLSKGMVALVDDEDYELVSQYVWHARKVGQVWYAQRNIRVSIGSKTTQYMHVLLTGFKETDHINRNGLDNRRENLRDSTHSENMRNRVHSKKALSPYKGVTRSSYSTKKWRARISVNKKNKHLGYFDTPEEAALAYNEAALQHYGAFALLNEVPHGREIPPGTV